MKVRIEENAMKGERTSVELAEREGLGWKPS